MAQVITLTKPDDFHVHLRSGDMMRWVAPFSSAQFGRILVMPNVTPPIRTVGDATQYRAQILDACTHADSFDPKMSLYLTDETSLQDIREAAASPDVLGFKLYPAGATTNSAAGVSRIFDLLDRFEEMAKLGVVLQVHGEVTDVNVDIYDREKVFIEQVLSLIHRELPELKIVLEHITTSQGVEFVHSTPETIAGTITPQHLLFNRNMMFRGGIRPHNYCLPVLKREEHRLALLEAATSGNAAFFLGTDSAPHTRRSKESACGCAGIFSANAAIELYAEVFDGMNRLANLEAFASVNGANFYGLSMNQETITLEKTEYLLPESLSHIIDGYAEELIPLFAGNTIAWKLIPTDRDAVTAD